MDWSSTPGVSPVLAIDTSTRVASVALLGPGVDLSAEGRAESRSDDLIALIDGVLGEAGVELAGLAAVAIGAGPGSFTGLRIGMATAKGLCFAAGLPLWSVSSLAALALDAAAVEPLADTLVVPAFDARRGEVCAGFFRVEADRVDAMGAERIMVPAELAAAVAELLREAQLSRAVLIGDALESHGAALAGVAEPLARARITPTARSVARLALAGPRLDVVQTGTPVYIRPSAAEVTFPDGNPGSRLLAGNPGKE
jgi:tRNA threonylcarbamoyladenosine biosynthesis protein TsaB